MFGKVKGIILEITKNGKGKSMGKIGNLKTPQCKEKTKPNAAGSYKICQDSPDFRLDVLFNFEIYDRKSKLFIFSQPQILYIYNCFSSQICCCKNFPLPLRPSHHILMFIFF